MCKNKREGACAYNCEHKMIIYTEIRNSMNKNSTKKRVWYNEYQSV